MESSTEILRKLLDERGVEYDLLDESIAHLTMWQTCYEGLRHECQFDERHGESKLEIWDCTPEQAIAATLGGQPAKLTAEQVRKAIERNFGKVAVIDDGCEKVEWREGWVCNVGFNSQAIADDLNATLGGDGKSRWAELFGTPERAARTLSVTAKCFEPETACRECIYKGYCDTQCDYDALLGWLEGDA